jgi:4-hydroxy-3-methylbut-2-en-1-yl diphosphate synthase IspG/GcpE
VIEWIFIVILSAIIIGSMSYMVVWGMHNFELTVNTIMMWADRQETFLQKMISCPVCLSVQSTIALTSLHCLAFNLGLWTWMCVAILGCLVALALIKTDPLMNSK